MKKLMILAAAAIMAGFANAAAVAWNSGTVYNPNSTGDKIGKQTGDYVMTIAFYTYDSELKTYNTFAAGGALSDDSTLAPSTFSGSATGFELSKTYYAIAQITTKSGDWTITTDYTAFTTLGTGDSSINFGTGAGLTGSTAAWNTQSIGKEGDLGKWVAAPEPTSGLLLLIGMAGLALRRRRA